MLEMCCNYLEMLSSDNCGCHLLLSTPLPSPCTGFVLQLVSFRFFFSSSVRFPSNYTTFIINYRSVVWLRNVCTMLCDARETSRVWVRCVRVCMCVCVRRHRVMKLNKQMTCWMPVEIVLSFFLSFCCCCCRVAHSPQSQSQWQSGQTAKRSLNGSLLAAHAHVAIHPSIHLYTCTFMWHFMPKCRRATATTTRRSNTPFCSTWVRVKVYSIYTTRAGDRDG